MKEAKHSITVLTSRISMCKGERERVNRCSYLLSPSGRRRGCSPLFFPIAAEAMKP